MYLFMLQLRGILLDCDLIWSLRPRLSHLLVVVLSILNHTLIHCLHYTYHATTLVLLLDPTVPTDPLYRVVSNLSNSEKYNLLYHHKEPPTLPSTNVLDKNRKFNVSWLEKYPWLLYSPKVDGVFCGPCSILHSSSDRADKVINYFRTGQN